MFQNLRLAAERLWQQFSWPQRITTIGLSIMVIAAITLLVEWANAPTYNVLFSGLSTADASAIVTQLNSTKVPYQLTNGGTTILVPQPLVDTTRLQLAGQGLPQGGVVGYSLFDKNNVFQGDSFTEQVNLTRALEGELTQTIGALSGVAYDRVSIVLPQQQLFSSEQANPTASILLKLSPGATLTGDQIAGVQHLVASSVQGLKADDVTVVDSNGTILSSNASPSGLSSVGTTALQAQARYASNLEAQLTAMLETVVGPGRAVVRVNDVMDWTQREQTSNLYTPQTQNSPLSQSHVISSTSSGAGSLVGGIAGIASNVPTYGTKGASGTTGTGGSAQSQTSTDLSFANSNTISHIISAPGTVRQLSVAVLLNGVTNKTEIASLRQAVAAAVGFTAARGDLLTISSVPFDNSIANAATKAVVAAQQQNMMLTIARWAGLIIVPMLLLFLFRRMLVSSRLKQYDAYSQLDVVEQGVPLLASPDAKVALPSYEESAVRQSVTQLARERPEVVAGLVGRWIEEDRG